MSRILYFDIDKFALCSADGGTYPYVPRMTYKEKATFEIHFVRVVDGAVQAVDVSNSSLWACSIDESFNSQTSPMAESTDDDIDAFYASTGIISADMRADTLEFLTATGTSQYIPAWFCLKGYYESDGDMNNISMFPIYAQSIINPDSVPTGTPTSDFWTSDETIAYIDSNVISLITGATGTFITGDSKTVTVVGGLITEIGT